MITEITRMLGFQFMQKAFIIAIALALILPCIGLTILLKRLSMIGDTLAHSSLSGVAIGLALGFDPLLGAIVACVFAGLSIEFIRNKLKSYQEISTVVILAISIGIAGIFSSFSSSGNSISSYLFGSIVAVSDSEFYLIIIVSIIILAIYLLIYRSLYLMVFDAKSAQLMGINTKLISFIFTFLSAVSISLSARTIGSLIVSSILVIPSITAMQLTKTYKMTLILSIIISILLMIIGILLSYFYNLKPGSVIVLMAASLLVITLIFKAK